MFDEATEIAERIALVRPLDPQAHLFVGLYHLVYRPDLVRARADFNRALKLRPGYAEAKSFLQLLDAQDASTLIEMVERPFVGRHAGIPAGICRS